MRGTDRRPRPPLHAHKVRPWRRREEIVTCLTNDSVRGGGDGCAYAGSIVRDDLATMDLIMSHIIRLGRYCFDRESERGI